MVNQTLIAGCLQWVNNVVSSQTDLFYIFVWYLVRQLCTGWRSRAPCECSQPFLYCPKQVTSGFKPSYSTQTKRKKKKKDSFSPWKDVQWASLLNTYLLLKEIYLTFLSERESGRCGFSPFVSSNLLAIAKGSFSHRLVVAKGERVGGGME